MKVYFLGSVSSLPDAKDDYKKIVSTLESLGHIVVYEHVLSTNPDELDKVGELGRKNYYRTMQKNIMSSDFMVAEVSNPTPNVGYEVALALEQEKPVLVLYKSSSKVFPLLLGNTSDKLILRDYSEEDNIERILKGSIKAIKQNMDIRFNFFISPEISRYLDWISKYKRIPRSVYLRDKIKEDMDSNKEYKEFLHS